MNLFRAFMPVAVFSLAALGGVACATSSSAFDDSPVDSGIKADASTTTKDSGVTAPKDSGTPQPKVCVAKCTDDSECDLSCPAAPNGSNCCDVSTGACYQAAGATCPVPSPDAGGSTY